MTSTHNLIGGWVGTAGSLRTEGLHYNLHPFCTDLETARLSLPWVAILSLTLLKNSVSCLACWLLVSACWSALVWDIGKEEWRPAPSPGNLWKCGRVY